jgi:uncharacterized 2Fe-2S/4Fe-4S cluster protein (DUF4445 family)
MEVGIEESGSRFSTECGGRTSAGRCCMEVTSDLSDYSSSFGKTQKRSGFNKWLKFNAMETETERVYCIQNLRYGKR